MGNAQSYSLQLKNMNAVCTKIPVWINHFTEVDATRSILTEIFQGWGSMPPDPLPPPPQLGGPPHPRIAWSLGMGLKWYMYSYKVHPTSFQCNIVSIWTTVGISLVTISFSHTTVLFVYFCVPPSLLTPFIFVKYCRLGLLSACACKSELQGNMHLTKSVHL